MWSWTHGSPAPGFEKSVSALQSGSVPGVQEITITRSLVNWKYTEYAAALTQTLRLTTMAFLSLHPVTELPVLVSVYGAPAPATGAAGSA
jgi:hypothetical protein